MPKLTDYGRRRRFHEEKISTYMAWYDIVYALGDISRYIQCDKTHKKISELFKNIHTQKFSSVTDCYLYVRDKVFL